MPGQMILLVEDNADDVELAMHGFRKIRTDCRVEVVRDGEEALDFVFCSGRYADREPTDKPALVLLDIGLPGISGLEVLRCLRENKESRRIPVVILSTSDEDSDIVQSYNLGVNSYLCKPVEFSTFSDVLEQLGLYWLVMNVPSPN